MPSSGTLRTYNPAVTRFSLGYANERGEYVAQRALPPFPTRGEQTGQFYELSRANMFTPPRNAHRADGAESHEVRWTFSTANFNCEPRAYNTFHTPRQEKNVLGPLNLNREDSDFLTELILLEREIDVYNYLLTAVTAGVTLSGAFQWDDSGVVPTPKPRKDIHTGKKTIKKACGRWPNVMIIGGAVYDLLEETVETAALAGGIIAEHIKHTQAPDSRAILDTSRLASYWGIPNVYVAGAVQNTDGLKRTATVTNDYIWGDNILLAYVSPRPTMKTPTLGWTFTEESMKGYNWTKAERRNAKFIEVEEVVDERVVAPVCGYWIKNVSEA